MTAAAILVILSGRRLFPLGPEKHELPQDGLDVDVLEGGVICEVVVEHLCEGGVRDVEDLVEVVYKGGEGHVLKLLNSGVYYELHIFEDVGTQVHEKGDDHVRIEIFTNLAFHDHDFFIKLINIGHNHRHINRFSQFRYYIATSKLFKYI
jgi:hypothetical protein